MPSQEREDLQTAYQGFLDRDVFILTAPKDVNEEILKQKIAILRESFAGEALPWLYDEKKKKAFIVNSGEHWDAYTTEDHGQSFARQEIRGDGLCGLTATIYVHNFFATREEDKINVLHALREGEYIKTSDGTVANIGEGDGLVGQLMIGASTSENPNLITTQEEQKQKIRGNLIRNIGNDLVSKINFLLESERDKSYWLNDEDVKNVLLHSSNRHDLSIYSPQSFGSRSEDDNIEIKTITSFSQRLDDLKAQKARSDFLSQESTDFSVIKIDDLFPALEETNQSTGKKSSYGYALDCTIEDYVAKYLEVLTKLCENKNDLEGSEELNKLAKVVLYFVKCSDQSVRGFAEYLFNTLYCQGQPILDVSPAPASVVATKVPTITKEDLVKEIGKDQIDHLFNNLAQPNDFFGFASKNIFGGVVLHKEEPINKEDTKKQQITQKLQEELPDAFQPVPKKEYSGWGMEVEYNSVTKTLTWVKNHNNNAEIAGHFQEGKTITHIDDKTIDVFLRQQKKSNATMKQGELLPDDIPDIYYITHYFRAKNLNNGSIKLTFEDNNELQLGMFNEAVFARKPKEPVAVVATESPSTRGVEFEKKAGVETNQAKTDLINSIKEDLKEKIVNRPKVEEVAGAEDIVSLKVKAGAKEEAVVSGEEFIDSNRAKESRRIIAERREIFEKIESEESGAGDYLEQIMFYRNCNQKLKESLILSRDHQDIAHFDWYFPNNFDNSNGPSGHAGSWQEQDIKTFFDFTGREGQKNFENYKYFIGKYLDFFQEEMESKKVAWSDFTNKHGGDGVRLLKLVNSLFLCRQYYEGDEKIVNGIMSLSIKLKSCLTKDEGVKKYIDNGIKEGIDPSAGLDHAKLTNFLEDPVSNKARKPDSKPTKTRAKNLDRGKQHSNCQSQ